MFPRVKEVLVTFNVINGAEKTHEPNYLVFKDWPVDVVVDANPEDFSRHRITPRRLRGCVKKQPMVDYHVSVVIYLKTPLIVSQP